MVVEGTPLVRRFRWLPDSIMAIGSYLGETQERRGKRRIIVAALVLTTPVIAAVGIGRMATGHPWEGLGNIVQVGIHLAILGVLRLWPRSFAAAMHVLAGADIAIIAVTTLALGGLVASGLNVLWAFVSVVVALIALSRKAAASWFGVYAVAVILTLIGRTWLDTGERPDNVAFETTVNVIGASLLIFFVMIYFVRQREFFQRQSDSLLHNILPDSIATRLKVETSSIADSYESATVLFADVVGFTPMSAGMVADDLVALLDEIFSSLDAIVDELGLEKIKTIGDEYMVASGVPNPRADHAYAMAEFALTTRDLLEQRLFGGRRIELRIGVHSGPVVAGIIGDSKFSYDLWGDTVNTASRLESHGVPGEIHISTTTRDLISDRFECERRGMVDLKGKGETETWFLRART